MFRFLRRGNRTPVVRPGDIVSFKLEGHARRGIVAKRKGMLIQVNYTIGDTEQSAWIEKWDIVSEPDKFPGEKSPLSDPRAKRISLAEAAEAESNALIAKQVYMNSALSVIVVGASGDLAKKKTYPALLDLYSHGHLPMDVTIVGLARSALSDDELRARLRPFLDKLGAAPELVDRWVLNQTGVNGVHSPTRKPVPQLLVPMHVPCDEELRGRRGHGRRPRRALRRGGRPPQRGRQPRLLLRHTPRRLPADRGMGGPSRQP